MLSEPLLARPTRKQPSALWVALLGIACATAVVYACIKSSLQKTHVELKDKIMMMELDFNFTVPPKCLYEMAGVALSGTALLAAVAAIIPAFGFAEGGVEAESAAAAWQATFPNVEKESLFATLQSLGARGQLLSILKQGLPLVGTLAVASGAFCSKLEDMLTTRAAEDIANMTSAVFEQIERVERDSRALEQIRKAADESVEASKGVQYYERGDQKGVGYNDVWLNILLPDRDCARSTCDGFGCSCCSYRTPLWLGFGLARTLFHTLWCEPRAGIASTRRGHGRPAGLRYTRSDPWGRRAPRGPWRVSVRTRIHMMRHSPAPLASALRVTFRGAVIPDPIGILEKRSRSEESILPLA